MNGLFAIVGAGERGVIFSRLSGVDPVALPEGVHLKVPFVETVTYIDFRVQKMTNDVDASSKDMQSIKTSVSLNYHVQPDKAALGLRQLVIQLLRFHTQDGAKSVGHGLIV